MRSKPQVRATALRREQQSQGQTSTGRGVSRPVLRSAPSTSKSTTGKETFNVPAPTFEISMVSKGNPNANESPVGFSLHETFHLTMNANATISAFASNSRCK